MSRFLINLHVFCSIFLLAGTYRILTIVKPKWSICKHMHDFQMLPLPNLCRTFKTLLAKVFLRFFFFLVRTQRYCLSMFLELGNKFIDKPISIIHANLQCRVPGVGIGFVGFLCKKYFVGYIFFTFRNSLYPVLNILGLRGCAFLYFLVARMIVVQV